MRSHTVLQDGKRPVVAGVAGAAHHTKGKGQEMEWKLNRVFVSPAPTTVTQLAVRTHPETSPQHGCQGQPVVSGH